MSFWKFLLPNVGDMLRGGSRAMATFTGDKVQQESNVHDEQMQAGQTYASENLQIRMNRTWWDSLIDGINRLPRPLIAFIVIAEFFVWPVIDPISFGKAMTAYQLVPQWLAVIAGQIILLYFGGRMMDKWPEVREFSKEKVANVLNAMKDIEKLRPQPKSLPPAKPKPMDAAEFDQEWSKITSDSDEPISNEAIIEWNRRRGNLD